MKIGLLDVDGHGGFPNFALMRSSAYLKSKGHDVEWARPDTHYDEIWASKVFTFTPDVHWEAYDADTIRKGGTGYDIKGRLPEEIERSPLMDYTLYPDCDYSLQFFSRGCIRKCPFCLVRDKEGYICPVDPVDLNPNGKWIEILDNNFFANPKWRDAADYLYDRKQMVNFHGVDIRIMDDEQAACLNRLRHKSCIHIAWDIPSADLRPQLEAALRHIKPSKLRCYVLIGFNSTFEQDLHRVRTLKSYGIMPFVQPYRDYENKRIPTQYEKDFARWANNLWFIKTHDFLDFEPRKGFCCKEYVTHPELRSMPSVKEKKSARAIVAEKAQLSLML